jgi:glycosyltransferase involved in cell wall biosynthesis
MGIQNNNRSPLLTIAIPTYNRRTYIGELLPELVRQAESVDREIRELEIVISDNASSDGTEQYIKETVANKRVSYYRNQNNIGGDRNFLKCIERAQGKYVWLVGDDDILLPGALEKVFAILKGSSPALCIVGDGKYGGFKESLVFDDYGGFLSFMLSKQPHYIIAHTLITSNIFLKSVFDIPKARSLLHTFTGICTV